MESSSGVDDGIGQAIRYLAGVYVVDVRVKMHKSIKNKFVKLKKRILFMQNAQKISFFIAENIDNSNCE